MRVIVLSVLFALGACSAETGIIVSVSGASVDILEFYVGVEQGGRYILDEGATGTRVDVAGRNLAVAPYELLLEPGGDALSVRVLALGKHRGDDNDETLYSFAFTQEPQRFIEGKVLRRSISLHAINSTRWARALGGCHRVVFSSEESYALYPADDLDCDGYGTTQDPVDCADDDAEIFPGAFEYCDGKENNCDGNYAGARTPCYGVDQTSNSCFAGMRDCSEADGGGVEGECLLDLEGDAVAQAYCAAYQACEAPDSLRCAHSVSVASYACTLKMLDALQSCEGGTFKLEPPLSPEHCRWRVVQSGGFKVDLIDYETKESWGLSTALCKPLLRVFAKAESPEEGKVVVEFFADGEAGWVRSFEISQRDEPTCEDPVLACERR